MPVDSINPSTDRRQGVVPGVPPKNYLIELLRYGAPQIQMQRAVDFSSPLHTMSQPQYNPQDFVRRA